MAGRRCASYCSSARSGVGAVASAKRQHAGIHDRRLPARAPIAHIRMSRVAELT